MYDNDDYGDDDKCFVAVPSRRMSRSKLPRRSISVTDCKLFLSSTYRIKGLIGNAYAPCISIFYLFYFVTFCNCRAVAVAVAATPLLSDSSFKPNKVCNKQKRNIIIFVQLKSKARTHTRNDARASCEETISIVPTVVHSSFIRGLF